MINDYHLWEQIHYYTVLTTSFQGSVAPERQICMGLPLEQELL